MLYIEHKPGLPLSSFIQTFWYAKGYDAPHRRERVFPNGTIQLILNLAADKFTGDGSPNVSSASALVVGVHSEYIIINTADIAEMIGVQFRPGCATPFLGTGAGDFQNAEIALADVWGSAADRLRDRLREATAVDEKFRILERALLAHGRHDFQRSGAVDFAIEQFRSSPEYRVDEIAREIGLSRRRFGEVFRDQVGVPPKLYCRIVRFQRALREMSAGRSIEWTELALSCGYFDQSHFVNDFRAFSGINPTTYVSNRLNWINHIAVDD